GDLALVAELPRRRAGGDFLGHLTTGAHAADRAGVVGPLLAGRPLQPSRARFVRRYSSYGELDALLQHLQCAVERRRSQEQRADRTLNGRGCISISVGSPKKSPSKKRISRTAAPEPPAWTATSSPAWTTYIDLPGSPSRKTASPLRQERSTSIFTSRSMVSGA